MLYSKKNERAKQKMQSVNKLFEIPICLTRATVQRILANIFYSYIRTTLDILYEFDWAIRYVFAILLNCFESARLSLDFSILFLKTTQIWLIPMFNNLIAKVEYQAYCQYYAFFDISMVRSHLITLQ